MDANSITDTFRRPLRDLRISVTDRCNLRCVYCMPKEIFGRDFVFMPRDQLLTFEEITRLASIAVAHGVRKIRLTGGEPLLRKDIEVLVRMLARLRTTDGLAPDLAMTTNGSVLAQKAQILKDAGLSRVTVSLDSLREETFQAMNDVGYTVAKVLHAAEVAQAAGLRPVKINMVVKRGTNDQDILDMASHFKGSGLILRFIEYMDVGASNGWKMDEVVPSTEVLARINAVFPLERVPPNYPGETSDRWRYADGSGEIGVISSVTQAFCRGCTRARLSADGKLFTCLFATAGTDLRAMLRGGASDVDLSAALAALWGGRTDRYSELRRASTPEAGAPPAAHKIEMSYIGG
ncbi:GTP 3',8-cyclase MoaA [Arthrobacter oryzae]|uniref:GTP 3',8-cyclase n=1 Tax=Arthrobacter oryzae TaxID=409290 RepID=A0A495EQN1_9MICC|nr:GTP 3',8-cyclase MoaA [Arthrobacter oryzae]RKR18903.1 cyclic pyranopterin monophosphate synthase subunit MoaA [Arthrobacter oryzae]